MLSYAVLRALLLHVLLLVLLHHTLTCVDLDWALLLAHAICCTGGLPIILIAAGVGGGGGGRGRHTQA